VTEHKWRLPAGVDQVLAPRARQLEMLRRHVLDVFHSWGFDYVEPPIIEFADSLLVGGDESLDLQTLKVVDQVSGRLLGVRSDMTAQAVRIDAHNQRRNPTGEPARLCYAGTVVHAVPFGVHGSRVPLKAGAEIFGVANSSADAEVVALLVDILQRSGMQEPTVVLGHMGIYRALVADLGLEPSLTAALLAAMQSKSETDIVELLPAGPARDLLVRLPTLMGDHAVFADARSAIGSQHPKALAALDELEQLAGMVDERCQSLQLRFDLAELAGFGYHNGPLFSAYHPQVGHAVARGGRYDNLSEAFGSASRAATGFDVNLQPLLDSAVQDLTDEPGAVWVAPELAAAARSATEIQRLRATGHRVVVALTAAERPPADCTTQLIQNAEAWSLQPLTA
jgi:ATP phosphoribosyltransferase regulatory subunit